MRTQKQQNYVIGRILDECMVQRQVAVSIAGCSARWICSKQRGHYCCGRAVPGRGVQRQNTPNVFHLYRV
jgi:hypothetical protein